MNTQYLTCSVVDCSVDEWAVVDCSIVDCSVVESSVVDIDFYSSFVVDGNGYFSLIESSILVFWMSFSRVLPCQPAISIFFII